MTYPILSRANRPYKYRTCPSCQYDNWFLASDAPPRGCQQCLELFDYEDRTPLVARIAWFAMWILGAILVAVLVLHAVR